MSLFLLYFFGFLAVSATHAAVIVPGATWTDTSGNVIQAHGGGFLKVGSTFYWHGEDKAHNSGLFRAVSCYTSTDLTTWTRQNDALTPVSGTNISTSNIVERPKVVFNKANSEYVMWFHSDSSKYVFPPIILPRNATDVEPSKATEQLKSELPQPRRLVVLTVTGAVSDPWARSPATWVFSKMTMVLSTRFVQEDAPKSNNFEAAQTTYLLYASDNNQNFKISKLDTDYYNVASQVSVISASTLESPGVVKRNGVYYLIASHTSGWDPNPNKFFTASSLAGPWSSQADIAPSATRTYFSQNAFDYLINSNFAIYMGDRWRPSLLGSSRYIWYPLSWSSGVPQIVHADVWSLDLSAGAYTAVSGTTYEAESGTIGGSATTLSDSSFSGGKAIGYLGNGGSITINNVQGTGSAQWVALYYANGDSTWRNTTVSVNGGASILVDQPNTGGGHVILSVPVKVNLNNGANSITVGSGQSNYAADLDKIIVYTAT